MKASNNELQKVLIASDVESRGPSAIDHGILSVGVCVGLADELRVLEKVRFDFKPMQRDEYGWVQTYEEKCQKEFWSKHEDKKNIMEQSAKPWREEIKKFRTFIDKYDDGIKWEAILISDTTAFGPHFINTYLEKASLPPLQYDSTRKNIALSEM